MFELSVRDEFCASHAILINGEREPIHGHNWRVTLVVQGPKLDAEGLLCDFHALEQALRETINPWRNQDLTTAAAFTGLNPTAEMVAYTIARLVSQQAAPFLEGKAAIASVSVTEAPGCVATYRPAQDT